MNLNAPNVLDKVEGEENLIILIPVEEENECQEQSDTVQCLESISMEPEERKELSYIDEGGVKKSDKCSVLEKLQELDGLSSNKDEEMEVSTKFQIKLFDESDQVPQNREEFQIPNFSRMGNVLPSKFLNIDLSVEEDSLSTTVIDRTLPMNP